VPDAVVTAPFAGTVIAIAHGPDERVQAGVALVVLEAMKMEHEIVADRDGVVRSVEVTVGETVAEGQVLAVLDAGAEQVAAARETAAVDLDAERSDLAAVRERHEVGLDAARPDAVARRHEQGGRTARENLADLVDDGTFVRPAADSPPGTPSHAREPITRTPADGPSAASADRRPPERRLSYDYMVLAGTQGFRNHLKKDRLFDLARHAGRRSYRWPRAGAPGDVDSPECGLDVFAFGCCQAQRARAAGRADGRLLLRRQRGAARLLRRDHRDREPRR
jgi:pyruvate/2-oxoglutarate dehydrogenase complex dihydrolipoamide acyltransferase (E2) component